MGDKSPELHSQAAFADPVGSQEYLIPLRYLLVQRLELEYPAPALVLVLASMA